MHQSRYCSVQWCRKSRYQICYCGADKHFHLLTKDISRTSRKSESSWNLDQMRSWEAAWAKSEWPLKKGWQRGLNLHQPTSAGQKFWAMESWSCWNGNQLAGKWCPWWTTTTTTEYYWPTTTTTELIQSNFFYSYTILMWWWNRFKEREKLKIIWNCKRNSEDKYPRTIPDPK